MTLPWAAVAEGGKSDADRGGGPGLSSLGRYNLCPSERTLLTPSTVHK